MIGAIGAAGICKVSTPRAKDVVQEASDRMNHARALMKSSPDVFEVAGGGVPETWL